MICLQQLDDIINNIIAPAAQATDRDGVFPRAVINAMGDAGLLGLISAVDVGGMGRVLNEAPLVVERIARR